MQTYQWTSAFLGLAIAGIILWLVRRDHLHTRYALWWIPIAVAIGLLGVFPTLIDGVAQALGIAYGPILPLIIGIGLLVIKILMMDMERSRNEVKLQRLIQRMAILEGELAQLRRSAPAAAEPSRPAARTETPER
jgi:hypothetical protein